MPSSESCRVTSLKVSSRQNKRIKRALAARDRRSDSLLFLEGVTLVEDGLKAGLSPEMAVASDSFVADERSAGLLGCLSESPGGVLRVPDWLMKEISCVQTPPGIIMLAPRDRKGQEFLPEACSFVVVAHGLQDPGNLGSVLRSSEAAGADGAIVTEGSTDPLGPRALRGSMGAALRLPLWYGVKFEAAAAECRRRGLRILASTPRGEKSFWDADLKGPCALVLGGESEGLSPEEMRSCDETVRIPMASACESLNVGAAAALLLFEVARQRRS